MDATKAETTIAVTLPWIKMTFDYMEKLVSLIPDELLDWRPEDPSGKWSFSLAEIAMHCADARIMFARQMTGSDSREGYWSEGPGEDQVWKFREYETKQAIADSLVAAREELGQFLDMSSSRMNEVTEGSREVFKNQIKWMQENGHDTKEMVARGPASIVRVLMAAACHEAGHRGSLQTLLRLHGVNASFGE